MSAVGDLIEQHIRIGEQWGFSREDTLAMLATEANHVKHMAGVSALSGARKMMLDQTTAAKYADIVAAVVAEQACGNS